MERLIIVTMVLFFCSAIIGQKNLLKSREKKIEKWEKKLHSFGEEYRQFLPKRNGNKYK